MRKFETIPNRVSQKIDKINKCQRLLAESLSFYKTCLLTHSDDVSEALTTQKYLQLYCALEGSEDNTKCLSAKCNIGQSPKTITNDDAKTSIIYQRLCIDLLDFQNSFFVHGNNAYIGQALRAMKFLKTLIAKGKENAHWSQSENVASSTADECDDEDLNFSEECQRSMGQSLQLYDTLIKHGNGDSLALALSAEKHFKSFTGLWKRKIQLAQIDNENFVSGCVGTLSLETKPLCLVNSPKRKRKCELVEENLEEAAKKFRLGMMSDLEVLGDFSPHSNSSLTERSQQWETTLDEQVENTADKTVSSDGDIAISSNIRSITVKTSKLSYGNMIVDSGTKFGIVPSKFPEIKLAESHKAIIAYKLHKMFPMLDKDIMIENLNFENGLIIVTCHKIIDFTWIKDHSQMLQLPELSLDVIRENHLPLILGGIFQASSYNTTEEIMEFISCQNVDLQVDEWKVFERKDKEDGSVEMAFAIPSEDSEALESANFTIDFKFSTVTFRRKASSKEDETAETIADLKQCPPIDWTVSKVPLCVDIKFRETTDQSYINLRQKIETNPAKYKDLMSEDGIIYKLLHVDQETKVKVYKHFAPNDFIPEILKSVHDDIGHASFKISFKKLSDEVHFEGYRKALKEYISNCTTCNASKPTTTVATVTNASEDSKSENLTVKQENTVNDSTHDDAGTQVLAFHSYPKEQQENTVNDSTHDDAGTQVLAFHSYPKEQQENTVNVSTHDNAGPQVLAFHSYPKEQQENTANVSFHDDAGTQVLAFHSYPKVSTGVDMNFQDTDDPIYIELRRNIEDMPSSYPWHILDNGIIYKVNCNKFMLMPLAPSDFIPKLLKLAHDDIGHANRKIGGFMINNYVHLKNHMYALDDYIRNCAICKKGIVSNETDTEMFVSKHCKYPKVSIGADLKFQESTYPSYIKLRKKIEDAPLKYPDFTLEDGIIYKLDYIVYEKCKKFLPMMPKDFISTVLKKVHDDLGHSPDGIPIRSLRRMVNFVYLDKALVEDYIRDNCSICSAMMPLETRERYKMSNV